MNAVDINDVGAHLSGLLQRVSSGEEIVIASAGRPIAKLIPFHEAPQRIFGLDEGVFEVPDDFDAPLPPDIVDAFEK